MGFPGLTTLLREQGWLPKPLSCSFQLWASHHMSAASDRLVCIPPGSTLAIDGHDLVFHLHNVAYSRHFSQVIGVHQDPQQKDGSCTCNLQNLPESQVHKALPQSMPLSLIDQVAREFVEALHSSSCILVVYWDKSNKAPQRFVGTTLQWSNLHQYCLYGTVPPTTNLCQNHFLSSFPVSQLLVRQVKSTLTTFAQVRHVQCTSGSIREVAFASYTCPTTFCVGLNSEFSLFPNTNFIPLTTLNVSGNTVTGCLITRSELTCHLCLPDEHGLIEFAILTQHNHVGENPRADTPDFGESTAEQIIQYLQTKGEGYQVFSETFEVQEELDIMRSLYSFDKLDNYQQNEKLSVDSFGVDEMSFGGEIEFERPRLPSELDLSLAAPIPMDSSLLDTLARPIEVYMDTMVGNDIERRILHEHVVAWVQMKEALADPSKATPPTFNRPSWDNVHAAYIYEQILEHILRNFESTLLVRLSSPMMFFDHFLFHSMIEKGRISLTPGLPATVDLETETVKPMDRVQLPIDEYDKVILDTIKRQRVSIIHGETGCGKSSRVPIIILRAPPPDKGTSDIKIFVAQPRRIAAKSLVERVRSCEPDLAHKIALRMGHGVREYESSQTRLWFVTTGYLVRLLANMPEKFNDVSHLIIDEVHERSIDMDILCLLCKRLLESNTRIRLILMSATLAADLYVKYFNVSGPTIHVGARKFPIKEYFVEDLADTFRLKPIDAKRAAKVGSACDSMNCKATPNTMYMADLYILSVQLTSIVARPGGSVLIFVPGMNDIISLVEKIEKVHVPGCRFVCVPIHSDIPFEEQMTAFDTPDPDEVKVIIATNAAESSITLPNVDHVICLGLCRQITYNPASHRQLLTTAWISQASAKQRAGRTGRVREGNVYRLYTRVAFDCFMDKFEQGEMLRTPLDSVILSLKEMMNEQATVLLRQCIEPPDISTIQRSFKSLYDLSFISSSDDSCVITKLGLFVSSLGIDLTLGYLIGLGVQFGVGAEAIEMAATMALPQGPWNSSNPLYHEPPLFNDITSKTFIGRCHFDSNLYSDPLATMNIMYDFERVQNKHHFAKAYGLSEAKLSRMLATRNTLRNRVALFIGVDSSTLNVVNPPTKMPHGKLTILRVLQVWCFNDSMIELKGACCPIKNDVAIALSGEKIGEAHLLQVLNEKRHDFVLVSSEEVEQNGELYPDDELAWETFLPDFEARFTSYGLERGMQIMSYQTEDFITIFVPSTVALSAGFAEVSNSYLDKLRQSSFFMGRLEGANLRGRKARSAGIWERVPKSKPSQRSCKVLRWMTQNVKEHKSANTFLKEVPFQLQQITTTASCMFSVSKADKLRFSITLKGPNCELSKQDLTDLLPSPSVHGKPAKKASQQLVRFSLHKNVPMHFNGKKTEDLSSDSIDESSSWYQPLMQDIPEGARLLSVLASGRRDEHAIFFSDEKTEKCDAKAVEVEAVKVCLSKADTKISTRWKRFGTSTGVYLNENTVPAAAFPSNGPTELFACCAQSLELDRGRLKVECVTIMPPGRLFTLLSFLTFGKQPFEFGEDGKEDNMEELASESCRWLQNGFNKAANMTEFQSEKVQLALSFRLACSQLGEELKCFPDKVVDLLRIFDEVDGYRSEPWDDLYNNALTTVHPQTKLKKKLAKRKPRLSNGSEVSHKNGNHKRPTLAPLPFVKGTESPSSVTDEPDIIPFPNNDVRLDLKTKMAQEKAVGRVVAVLIAGKAHVSNGSISDGKIKRKKAKSLSQVSVQVKGGHPIPIKALPVDLKSNAVQQRVADLFLTELMPGASVSKFPSTNILALLVRQFSNAILQQNLTSEDRRQIEQGANVSLDDCQWEVIYVKHGSKSNKRYAARYIGGNIPFLPSTGRGKNSTTLPTWIEEGWQWPQSSKEAFACIPAQVAPMKFWETEIVAPNATITKVFLFHSLESALRMGAAFWLERQFYDGQRHWFQLPLEYMVDKAISSFSSSRSSRTVV